MAKNEEQKLVDHVKAISKRIDNAPPPKDPKIRFEKSGVLRRRS